MQDHWHTKTATELFEMLRTGEQGLSDNDARQRLQEYGLNKLPDIKAEWLPLLFLRQFQSPLIYILIAASIGVFMLGEPTDGLIILGVLFFNAIVGTVQEGRAQNTLLALKQFVATNATVVRADRALVIPDREVVPGDMLVLQEGDKVPADARVIVANNLKVDEAALTGESEPAYKTSDVLATEQLSEAEQRNMVFRGTHIVAGNGKAVVVATGTETSIGRISKKIAVIDTEIPLKANIRQLSRLVIGIVATMGGTLFMFGRAFGIPARDMFATVVSLAVSVIPEGLPIVMTLVLATGVRRMSKRNALVKRLQAVEALGQASILLVDKTGTITKNEMVVQKVYVDGRVFEVGGVGYEPSGNVMLEDREVDPLNHPELLFAGKVAAFCANAHVAFLEDRRQWHAFGDPTEAALSVLAQKLGFHKYVLEQESPQVAEIPFDYKEKYHATVHVIDGGKMLSVIGAPETILRLSSTFWMQDASDSSDTGMRRLTRRDREELESIVLKFSEQGLRVLGVAVRYDVPETIMPEQVNRLKLVGFIGMKDALRSEVHTAMQRSHDAGIRVAMITGDHKQTAQAIAKEAGIWRAGDDVLTGEDVERLSEEELSRKLSTVSVFARVTPEHKLKIVNAYKRNKEIVAMTGDGVNDALSLVAADLGVAMGKIGTEVAKEASDIVLLDDNFGSIVSAVEEGRNIYKTIKKVILYLFSTSIGEVLTITGALALGYPLPLLPAQIIWLNFVTDGFLDVALAMEPKEKGLLRGDGGGRSKKYLVDKLMAQRMVVMAVPMMIGTLALFGSYVETDKVKAWTIALTTLAVFQWFNAWNCRHESRSIARMDAFSNIFLTGATLIVVFLQGIALYSPWGQRLLHTVPLSPSEWLMVVPVAASVIVVEEVRKWWQRRKATHPANIA